MNVTVNNIAVNIQGQRIVDDISLFVQPGEVVGLIGPNGSGKSTLLRSIYRMLKPVAGYVRLNGDDVWKMNARESARRTGVVVQEMPSDFQFTVDEVVRMGRTPHKAALAADTVSDEAIVRHALQKVEMDSFGTRLFSTLSGGEKQRVLIARALAQQSQFLVLDEPTNHLDIYYQLEILDLVHSLSITSIITLHDLNLAAAHCQRLYLLSHGQLIASGTPDEVLTPERVHDVFKVHAVCGQHPVTGCLQLSISLPQRNG